MAVPESVAIGCARGSRSSEGRSLQRVSEGESEIESLVQFESVGLKGREEQGLVRVQDAKWNQYTAICVVTRNDPDIVEWVEYHRRIGIDIVYVFDHESETPLFHLLLPYIQTGFVVYQYTTQTPPVHIDLYEFCIHAYGQRHRWMGFIDTDEYVVIPSGQQVGEVLRRYEEYSGLAVNARIYASSGNAQRDPLGVLKSHTRCASERSRHRYVKSFVNPAKVLRVRTPHYAEYIDGGTAVTTDKSPHWGGVLDPPLLDVLYVNHYYIHIHFHYHTIKWGFFGQGCPTRYKDENWRVNCRFETDNCSQLQMPGDDWTPPSEVLTWTPPKQDSFSCERTLLQRESNSSSELEGHESPSVREEDTFSLTASRDRRARAALPSPTSTGRISYAKEFQLLRSLPLLLMQEEYW